MILRRLGNKSKIADEIQKHFPYHEIYQEPFFGAGGMFFNKPKAKFNFVNDLDSDVFNLFNVVVHNYEELSEKIEIMPIHETLIDHWRNETEIDPVLAALRFIFLSNFTLFGKMEYLRVGSSNSKDILIDNLKATYKHLKNVQFTNTDFRRFLKMYSVKDEDKKKCFIYCDPPYLDTGDNYKNSFTHEDANDLFDCLENTGCLFGYSEFDHPEILRQAEARGLFVNYIGERINIKNKRVEIFVTNYQTKVHLL